MGNTEFKVKATGTGFEALQQKTAKLIKEATKGVEGQVKGFAALKKEAGGYKDQVKSLTDQLKVLAEVQLKTTRALAGVKKGTDAYKQLKAHLKGVGEEAKRVQQSVKLLDTAFRDQAKSSGAFGQGFLQGATPGAMAPYLQRGPGAFRQAAGMTAGRAARGMAGGAASMAGAPFTGLQGIQQGLAGIPVVGGMLAGQLGTSMQYGQQALQYRQTQMSAFPQFGGNRRTLQEIRQRQSALGDYSKQKIDERVEAARKSAVENYTPTAAALQRGRRQYHREVRMPGEKFSGSASLATEFANLNAPTEAGEAAATKVRGEQSAERGRRIAAINEARNRPFRGIGEAGLKFAGINKQQSLQQAAGVMQTGGGGGRDLRQQDMLRTSFAAQTMFGVSGGTSGAFLQAGRTGGMVGAKGQGGEALAGTIGDAMSMGLEGSEINGYLQEMAAGITSWKQTGIPINSRSVAAMGIVIGKTGVGGVRGQRIASGIAGAARGVAASGIQSGTDLIMMQTLGGFKGGGMDAYEQAMMQMEEGNFTPEQMKEMLGTLRSAGQGGAGGRRIMRNAINRGGAGINRREMLAIDKSLFAPETMSDAERKMAAQATDKISKGGKAGRRLTADTLAQDAATVVNTMGGELKKQATIQNKQLDAGLQMVGFLQTLNSTTTIMSAQFAGQFAKLTPTLKKMEGLVEQLPRLITAIENFVSSDKRP